MDETKTETKTQTSATLTLELEPFEAEFLYRVFDNLAVQGPEGKRVAANIQAKIIAASNVVS